jgi:hypothetical protein
VPHRQDSNLYPFIPSARIAANSELNKGIHSRGYSGTNLSHKLKTNGPLILSLLLMDRRDFNTLAWIDDLIEAYIQTVMSTIALTGWRND